MIELPLKPSLYFSVHVITDRRNAIIVDVTYATLDRVDPNFLTIRHRRVYASKSEVLKMGFGLPKMNIIKLAEFEKVSQLVKVSSSNTT